MVNWPMFYSNYECAKIYARSFRSDCLLPSLISPKGHEGGKRLLYDQRLGALTTGVLVEDCDGLLHLGLQRVR